MIVKLPTEHHLEFLSLKGGCRGSSESTLVKMPLCWKSHPLALLVCGKYLVTSVLNTLTYVWNNFFIKRNKDAILNIFIAMGSQF